MDYRVISADSHIDLVWLPEDLFVSQAPARLKERMPKVVDSEQGKVWVSNRNQLGWVGSAGLTSSFDPYTPGLSRRLDKMEELNFFSDAGQGRFHPTDPELRVMDQEADGLQAEVLYGILGFASGFPDAHGGLSDPEIVTMVYDVYNEWVADFCRSNPHRFAGIACISCHDPETAAGQLRRAASLGLKGAELNASGAAMPIYQSEWDVLWATAAESGIPISFHTTGAAFRQPEGPAKEDYQWVTLGLMYTLFQLSGPEVLTSILLSGACDRYPDFRFVLGECGVGWIPYVLHRIDREYEDHLYHLNLSMKPSEFWGRQGYTTFQDEHLTPDIVQAVGEDNILWGSDYPHADGLWPESRQYIQRNLGHLPDSVQRKLVCQNAGALYEFI